MRTSKKQPFLYHVNQKIYGTVYPIEWSRNDSAQKFAITTRDGEEIVIENNKFNKTLMSAINREVEAVGTITEDEFGDLKIWLKKLRILNGPPAPIEPASIDDLWWGQEFSLNLPKHLSLQLSPMFEAI